MALKKVLLQASAGLVLLLLMQAGMAKYKPSHSSVGQLPVRQQIASAPRTVKKPVSQAKIVPAHSAQSSVKAPGSDCISCHADKVSPGAVEQWHSSKHAKAGITCIQCHGAKKEEVDSWLHKGSYIASIITPQDCAKCHTKEATEFMASHHSTASLFIGSLDNYLGAFVEGHQATVSGCKQCHGSRMKLTKHFQDGTNFGLDMEDVSTKALANLKAAGKDPMIDKDELRAQMNRLVSELWQPYAHKQVKPERAGITIDKDTWPNSGMGRINPDGSMGSCNACHSRHTFSKALARQPDNCGKCHMGPDHPQIEIYNESKHGIAFRNRLSEMNLDHPQWIVGKDYSAAPTCATCHMSATTNQPVTHDVGLRISYTLRPVISKLTTSHSAKLDDFG
ncbi:MAG: hypothetical protein HY711_03305, partial [Candidatus Melainabacteria bacterium]|nr:hypothetical protein [Candidatus Melainabacteria bacterium]